MPQKLRCKVADLVNHGEHVYSVFLKPDMPAPRFVAGQFLHLALDAYEPGDFWPESRAFSIASSPADRNLLAITYAVKGKFTTRMEAELCVGREVCIKLPYGEFTVNAKQDACLLAGGTGITAFAAFISGLTSDCQHPVYVFYGARSPRLLIYRSMIESTAKQCANLKSYFLIEEGDETKSIKGRLNLETVWQSIPDPLSVTYYLSGPPVMLKTLFGGLMERGVPSSQITVDAWD